MSVWTSVSACDLGNNTENGQEVEEAPAKLQLQNANLDEQNASTSASYQLNPIEQVCRIDALMKEIVSNIVDFKSRSVLEAVSRRMYYLSRSTKFSFPIDQDYLRLIFRCWHHPILTVAVGTLEFSRECLSFSARRDQGHIDHQPAPLMNLLNNVIERVNPKSIRRLQIGGITPEDLYRGVRNHLLVCTADLLQMVERFKNLRSITFENVHFDDGAIDFLFSEECAFYKHLENISFNKVTFDARNIARAVFKRIFTPNLKKFSLNTFAVGSQGNSFLEALEEINHTLDQLDIYVDEDAFGSEVTIPDGFVFMKRCSQRTRNLKVHFWHTAYAKNVKVFGVAKDICKLTNITELNLDVWASFNDESVQSVAFVCKNLSLLNQLKSFSIGGFRSDERHKEDTVIKCLISGVRKCQTLEKFHLTRVPKRDTLFTKLLEVLPSTLLNLGLDSTPFSDAMILGVLNRLPMLRHLSLKQMGRLTPKVVEFALRQKPELLTFATEVVCSMSALHLLTDHPSHPKLRHVEICVINQPSDKEMRILGQYFRGIIVDHILLHPVKNRKGYLVTTDWQIPTAPAPANELQTLTVDDLAPPRRPHRSGRRVWVENEWKAGWK
ncbi:unnamed protein product, partial [Mesorhabditis belari]|uniref:Uncharacterized protein n=1 Tax=Mesorhabditis belari TaxID=2138241 RepID=A0AAF3EWA5_9BILA